MKARATNRIIKTKIHMEKTKILKKKKHVGKI